MSSPVQVSVPRDRDASFEPKIVAKRHKRLTGVDELVISLAARGLTTGDIAAHLAGVYGAEVSRQAISTITGQVIEGMAEWQNRPLDAVYPVIFIGAVHVKIRDGHVANRPVYVALAVTCEGRRDILGLWAGDGGEGARYWLHVLAPRTAIRCVEAHWVGLSLRDLVRRGHHDAPDRRRCCAGNRCWDAHPGGGSQC